MLDRSYASDVKAGNIKGQATALLNMGNVYFYEGNQAQADLQFRNALQLATNIHSERLQAIAHLGIGRIAEYEGRFSSAIEELTAGKDLAEKAGYVYEPALALTYFADTYAWMGKPNEAISYFQQSVDRLEKMNATSDMAAVLAQMAEGYYKAGNIQSALEIAGKSEGLGEQIGERDIVWRARVVAGQCYLHLHQLQQAKAEFTAAIAEIERVRLDVGGSEPGRQTYLANKTAPYQHMLDIAAKEQDLATAFRFAERAKARVLLDVFRGARTSLRKQMTGDEVKQDEELRLRIALLNTTVQIDRRASKQSASVQRDHVSALDKARLEYSDFEAKIFARHPGSYARSAQVPPISIEEAAKTLPANGVLIEFTVTDDKLYAIVIAPAKAGGDPVAKLVDTAVSRQDLTTEVQALQKAMEDRSPAFRGTADKLSHKLLGPIAALIEGRNFLVIVPDGPLWDVPFYALPSPEGGLLIDRHTVCYSPSATAIRAMRELRQQRHAASAPLEFFAMANPVPRKEIRERVTAVYRGMGYAPLPSAEHEVKELQQIYGRAGSEVYTGTQARESLFKQDAPQARIIHLVTHATLDDNSPLYSNLLLAAEPKGSQEDGLLETWELLRLDLHAELAVLSACATARGEDAPGEGVIGLSWACFVSGVPAVVVSQWKVQSDSTSDLMIAFHRYRRSGVSDAAALRTAALSLRRKPGYEHPFYWAPFSVIGAGY